MYENVYAYLCMSVCECVSVCMSVCMCGCACVLSECEDHRITSRRWFFPTPCLASGGTQAATLGKHLYLLSHLTGPLYKELLPYS